MTLPSIEGRHVLTALGTMLHRAGLPARTRRSGRVRSYGCRRATAMAGSSREPFTQKAAVANGEVVEGRFGDVRFADAFSVEDDVPAAVRVAIARNRDDSA